MKSIKIAMLVFTLFSFSPGAYSQLWQQYSDSAKSFNDQKKMDKAIEYYYKAKEELPKDSIETNSYARICNSLANVYKNMRQYEKAEPLYIEAKNIREKGPGKEHADYASTCYNLANLYNKIHQYVRAEPLYLEAIQIREKLFGKEDPDYASYCNNLAYLYWKMGQYQKAEPLYAAAEYVWGKTPGKEHPVYASVCNNIANLYKEMGQYEKAEPLYLEAKNIREKALGKQHTQYAESCNNLAILYDQMGQYERAEPLFLETKQIRAKTIGQQPLDYAKSCNNLANLYSEMGQYEKAEPLFLEAKKIKEKMLGKEDPDYASTCGNLANLYKDKAEYEKAEPLYIEAKQIEEKVLSKEHPQYASTCNNLAILYMDMGQYEKAEPLYLEAKQIREKMLGKEHPDYAGSCNDLAVLYEKTGQYEKAEPLYLEARQIWEKALGKEYLYYAATYKNLAILYMNMRQYEKANTYYVEALNLQRARIQKIFQFTSEAEKQSYLKESKLDNNVFFSFNYSDYSSNRQGFTYDASLTNRNLILSSLQQLRNVIYNTTDTSIQNKYNNWINLKQQLSLWYTKPIAERPAHIIDLEEQANTLEKELARLSSAFRKDQKQNEVTWKNIQQSLQPTEAAIEFLEFRFSNGKRLTDSSYYIALLLRKDQREPRLIQLFEKKQLDTLLNSEENQTIDGKINALYTGNKSLYNLTWNPLEKYLHGISKVFFASAGNLFKISFAALPVNDKQVLGDKYQLIQLNTTATVTDNKQSFITASDKIQLYGGVQYDVDSSKLKQAVSQYQTAIASSRSLPGDLTRGAGFQYLPGTLREVETVKKQAGNTSTSVTVLSGINATEESIKALSGKASPLVLHIATHGFFFPDPKDDKRDSQRKFETSGKAFKQSDNPLFRSGLLFAGANNAWQGKPVEGIEDGILTAYEVSNLYLPNTKLVVLSACETALGDIQGSEGVYGLQRAFKMAGVQNLVMSLWKIGDTETAEFMQLFYKNMFNKQSVNDAFYNAQAIMKSKYRNEPYKWAAWVLVR